MYNDNSRSVPRVDEAPRGQISPFAREPSSRSLAKYRENPEESGSSRRRESDEQNRKRGNSKDKTNKKGHANKAKESGSANISVSAKAAAKRQAITELLFFSCVGSLADCKRLVKTFDITISDPNTADYDKRTPLHLASAEGHVQVVTWLLSKKADPSPIDRFKRTPLEEAVRGDFAKIVSLLINHKGKVVGQDGNLVDLALSHLSGNVNVNVGGDL